MKSPFLQTLVVLFCFCSTATLWSQSHQEQLDQLMAGPNTKAISTKTIPLTLNEGTTINQSATNEGLTAATTNSAAANDAGSTAGALSVSATGGATYSIPIYAPPGIKNVAPQIALTYSSQAGNGLAGWGWNISGLSTITRMGPNEHLDGGKDAVTFTQKDRFALDGQRLVVTQGTYGASNAVYGTENHSNLKIVSYGTSHLGSQYGPSHFVVHYPNGNRAWYGQTTDAKGFLEWAINKWQDPQGNYIKFEYKRSYNLLRITKIGYGTRAGQSTVYSLNFEYKTRNRPISSFIKDIRFDRTHILEAITVNHSSGLLRRYQIDHRKSDMGYETIHSVQESNGGNKRFAPIVFQYNNTSNGIQSLSNYSSSEIRPGITRENSNSLAGDFNGDGKMDFLSYYKNQKNKVYVFTNLHQWLGNNRGLQINTGSFSDVISGPILSDSGVLLPQHGITTIREGSSNTRESQVTFKTYTMGGGGAGHQYSRQWEAPNYSSDADCNSDGYRETDKRFVRGDFNGDGLMDVMALTRPYIARKCQPSNDCGGGDDPKKIAESNSSSCCRCTEDYQNVSKAYFINLDRRLTTDFANNAGQLSFTLGYSDLVFAADLTGNGRTELVHIKSGRIDVYSMGNSNRISKIISLVDNHIKTDHPILVGDYNGDGKMDLATPIQNGSNQWRFFVFKGANYDIITLGAAKYEQDYTTDPQLKEFHYIAQDFNGDGRTDILKHSVTTSSASSYASERFELFVKDVNSNGSDFFLKTVNEPFGNTGAIPYGMPLFLEAQHANQNLEYAYITGNTIRAYAFTKDHRKEMRLQKVSNNGVTQTINYTPLSAYAESGYPPHIYDPGYGQVYPFVNLNVARNVMLVHRLVEEGAGIERKQDFSYQGAVFHAQGLGFLGFESSNRSNWYGNGVTILWHNTKTDPKKRGATTVEWTSNYRDNNPGNYIDKTTYTRTLTTRSNGIYSYYPTMVTMQNSLHGVTTTRTITYDNLYNATKVVVSNAAGGVTEDYTLSNYPVTNSAQYHVGRLTGKKTTSIVHGASFTTEEQYGYSNNLMTSVKTRGAGTPWRTETFTYDAYGNVKTSEIKAPGMPPRSESFTYAQGRFLSSYTNTEGLKTTYLVDHSMGLVKEETDHYGNNTEYKYDDWGRLEYAIDIRGKQTHVTYDTLDDGGLKVTTDYDQGQDTEEHIDALGRTFLISQLSLKGKWISTQYQYDVADRTNKVSEPFWATDAPTQWSSTYYDEYGRVIEQHAPTGRITSLVYSGLTTTVDDGTKTATTELDASGNVMRVTDPGGTLTYSYHGNGALKTTDFAGQRTEVSIDAWGRKTKLVDPSAGTYYYTYDLYGQLLKEESPKGTTTYTYDAIGRPKKTIIQGDGTHLEAEYAYDSDQLLESVTGSDHLLGEDYAYTLEYNDYQLPSRIAETTAVASFEKVLKYDGYGRLSRETMTSAYHLEGNQASTSVGIRYGYDTASGMAESLSDVQSQKVLWQLKAHNARGQVLEADLGNDYVQRTEYDSYGLPKKITDVKGAAGQANYALRLEYTFNAQRGILENRKNLKLGWTEDFAHDHLDRLYNISGSVSREQNYDDLGRITDNSTIGDYNYESGKKYQLAGLDLNAKGSDHYHGQAGQKITYNAFKKPLDIESGQHKVSFAYGILGNRSQAWYSTKSGAKQGVQDQEDYRYHKSYSAIMPVEMVADRETGTTKIITYIGGDGYSAPIANLAYNEVPTGEKAGYYYLHRDYLGSIMAITDDTGALREQRQFGAWGTVDQFWASNGSSTMGHDSLLGRGYTGHEHFFEVGLIHMNGRMYDPVLGRFLSPDNFVQNPYSTQSFNRYGYVFNNPLRYTDPSGEVAEDEGANLLEYAVVVFVSTFKWMEDQGVFRGINKFFNKHIKGPVDDFFDWVHGRNKETKPPPAFEPLDGSSLSMDPLLAPRGEMAPILASNGGDSKLSQWANGLKDGFVNYYANMWKGLKQLTTDPMSVIKAQLQQPKPEFSLDFFTKPLQGTPLGGLIKDVAFAVDQIRALSSGDYYQSGYGAGDYLGDVSLEAGGYALGGAGGKFLKFGGRAVKVGTPTGKFYSVAFETTLAKNLYPGVNASRHFTAANKAMLSTLDDVTMKNMNIVMKTRQNGSVIMNRSPKNWVWHHDINKGVMQLVPKAQHTPGSIFWNTLHPGGRGGMSIWGGGY